VQVSTADSKLTSAARLRHQETDLGWSQGSAPDRELV